MIDFDPSKVSLNFLVAVAEALLQEERRVAADYEAVRREIERRTQPTLFE